MVPLTVGFSARSPGPQHALPRRPRHLGRTNPQGDPRGAAVLPCGAVGLGVPMGFLTNGMTDLNQHIFIPNILSFYHNTQYIIASIL